MRPSLEKDCKKYGSVRIKKKPKASPAVSDTDFGYDESSEINGMKSIVFFMYYNNNLYILAST